MYTRPLLVAAAAGHRQMYTRPLLVAAAAGHRQMYTRPLLVAAAAGHRQMYTRPLLVAAARQVNPPGWRASLLGMAVSTSDCSSPKGAALLLLLPPVPSWNSATPLFMSPTSTASAAGAHTGLKGTTQRPVLLLWRMVTWGQQDRHRL
jgi:hypothetical protein